MRSWLKSVLFMEGYPYLSPKFVRIHMLIGFGAVQAAIASALLLRMKESGINPTVETFNAYLLTCAHEKGPSIRVRSECVI